MINIDKPNNNTFQVSPARPTCSKVPSNGKGQNENLAFCKPKNFTRGEVKGVKENFGSEVRILGQARSISVWVTWGQFISHGSLGFVMLLQNRDSVHFTGWSEGRVFILWSYQSPRPLTLRLILDLKSHTLSGLTSISKRDLSE